MTNKEYIEKNNISFSDAMKMWNEKNYPCINDWLKADRIECPFKVGDFLRESGVDNSICVVIDIKDFVYFKRFTRDGTFAKWRFKDPHRCKYYGEDNTIYASPLDSCADIFEKIY